MTVQRSRLSTVHYRKMDRLGYALRCGALAMIAALLLSGCGKDDIDYSQAELTAASDTATVTNSVGRFLVGIEQPVFDLSGTTPEQTLVDNYLQQVRDGADKLESLTCRVSRTSGTDDEGFTTESITLDRCSWLFGTIKINGTYTIGIKTNFVGDAAKNSVTVKIMLDGFTFNGLQLSGKFEVTRTRDELTMSLGLQTPQPMLSLVASGNVVWNKGADNRTCMMVNAFGGISSVAGKIIGSFTDVKMCDGPAKGPCPEQGTLSVVGHNRHVVRLQPGSATYQRDDGPERDLPSCRN